ncbi:MAG: hypothetical protein WBM00_11350 [Solirubrobacterales bacterium]
MKKRYVVFGLSVVLALALAVPALGGPTNPIASVSASVKSIANKALKKAKQAQNTANTAQGAANNAQTSADKALAEAKKALTAGNNAQTSANTAKSVADAAKAAAAAAQSAADSANANANTRVNGSTEVIGTIGTSNTTTPKSSSVSCPADQPVLSGGYFIEGESNKITVVDNNNQLYGHGWFATAETISGLGTPTWRITAIAMCGTH